VGAEYLGDPNYCRCIETVLINPVTRREYRVPKPEFHDCLYIARVNLHLNDACRAADDGPRESWPQRFAISMNNHRRIVIEEMRVERRAQEAADRMMPEILEQVAAAEDRLKEREAA
jgi:hypothetical protein